jgi:hypothetical protein
MKMYAKLANMELIRLNGIQQNAQIEWTMQSEAGETTN